MKYKNVIEKYAESKDVPDHIIVIIGPHNCVMINLQTQQTYEIGINEIKKRILKEIEAT